MVVANNISHFLFLKNGKSISMMAIANCNSGVKSMSHVTGRCALFKFNVKLHIYGSNPQSKFSILAALQGPSKYALFIDDPLVRDDPFFRTVF